MAFRKLLKKTRFRYRQKGSKNEKDIRTRSPVRYDDTLVETVMTQEEDEDGCNVQRERSSAIYMFPNAWKERTGSFCQGASDFVGMNRNRVGTLTEFDNEIIMFGSSTGRIEDSDHAWDATVDADEDRYTAKSRTSSWMASSVSCLTCL